MTQIIQATVLDSTHLKLNQPISVRQGMKIQILISDETEEDKLWKEAGKRHFLNAYAKEDGIYDKL